jgi:hypothetical protein
MLARVGERTEALIAGAIVSGVYLLTLSGNHSETEDSLVFAVRVEGGQAADLFEAPHLIYDWAGRFVYESARTLGIAEDPVVVLQCFDAVLAGLTVGVLWLTLRRAVLSRLVAFATTGLLAGSYAFWRNGVEVEVYALAALALVIMLAAALRAVDRADARSFALLGLCHGAAVLAHFTAVLLAGMVVAALALADGRGQLMRMLGAYATAASAVVLVGYGVAIGVVGIDSITAFREWFSASGDPGLYGNVNPTAVAEATIGAARAFVGAHFLLSLEEVQTLLVERFPETPLREERFMVEDFDPTLALVLCGATVAIVLLLASAALRWLTRPALSPVARRLAILSLAWLVPVAAFSAYWNPLDIELWFSSWIPACILLALPLASASAAWRRPATAVSVALVGLLFLVNLLGSQVPQRDEESDYWRARTAWYAANTEPTDLIVANGYLQVSYLQHLTSAGVIDAAESLAAAERSDGLAELRRTTRRSEGTVYVTEETFYPFDDAPGACVGAPDVCVAGERARAAFLARAERVPAPGPERIWALASP